VLIHYMENYLPSDVKNLIADQTGGALLLLGRLTRRLVLATLHRYRCFC